LEPKPFVSELSMKSYNIKKGPQKNLEVELYFCQKCHYCFNV